jgi:hypothetical protein
MLKFLGFGRKKTSSAPVPFQKSVDAPNTQQQSDVQREMVRVVLKDVLRQSGIPAAWIGCEAQLLRRQGGSTMAVKLVVQSWHERLLPYLPALQQALIDGLDRFEPTVKHGHYQITWQFSPDCGCPHARLPTPQFWAPPPVASRPASTTSKSAFDLPPSEYDRVASPGFFAPTEPASICTDPAPLR